MDSLGRTALHFAAARGASKTSKALLDAGFAVDKPDSQKNTPLHLAAMRGQGETLELLLGRVQDKAHALTVANRDGLSVYHLALQVGAWLQRTVASTRKRLPFFLRSICQHRWSTRRLPVMHEVRQVEWGVAANRPVHMPCRLVMAQRRKTPPCR